MSDKFFNELKKKVLFFDRSLQLFENDNPLPDSTWSHMTRGIIDNIGFDFDTQLHEALKEENVKKFL